jgi:hypothetical protein
MGALDVRDLFDDELHPALGAVVHLSPDVRSALRTIELEIVLNWVVNVGT